MDFLKRINWLDVIVAVVLVFIIFWVMGRRG